MMCQQGVLQCHHQGRFSYNRLWKLERLVFGFLFSISLDEFSTDGVNNNLLSPLAFVGLTRLVFSRAARPYRTSRPGSGIHSVVILLSTLFKVCEIKHIKSILVM